MARISQASKEATRAAIIEASFNLFQTLGYDKTNTKTIAKQCAIAEGTIFNYFANKDEILMAVFEQMASQAEAPTDLGSLDPKNIMLETLLVPLKMMDAMSKALIMDILLSAMKLARLKGSLIQKLIAFDRHYVLEVEKQMTVYLNFERSDMTPKVLSEILYNLVAAEYLFYVYHSDQTFEQFEANLRQKGSALLSPYLKQMACK